MTINKIPLTDNININNIDFSKLIYYTEGEIRELMYNEDTYEIAAILKHNYKNNIDNSKYIKDLKSKNLSLSFLKNTLIFMISRWMPQAVLLQEEFNIETKDISLSVFNEWFINWMNWLNDSELLLRFVELYNDKQELLEEIWKINLLLLFDLVDYYWIEFKKFNNEKTKNIVEIFEKDYKSKKIFDKINEFWMYNWYEICWLIFEDYESAYQKIQKIFNLTEEEKEKFEELKQYKFFESYQKEIQLNIKEFKDIDFIKISESTMNDAFQWINTESFINKINELLIWMTIKDSYSIVFLDISWKKEQFNIWNNTELWGYNYGLLEKNNFLKHLIENFWEFLLNLNRNNIDFTILIFKQNWEKDIIPDEEDVLLAA